MVILVSNTGLLGIIRIHVCRRCFSLCHAHRFWTVSRNVLGQLLFFMLYQDIEADTVVTLVEVEGRGPESK